MRAVVFAAVLVTSSLGGGAALAQDRAGGDFGLGLIIGDPTGVNGKHMLATEHAVDWAVGFGILGGEGLHVHADYLWHRRVKRWEEVALDLYLGVGPKLGVKGKKGDDDVLIGARGPVGLAVGFLEAPFDVFVEIAAGLWIVEKVGFDIDAAIGGRYWF